MTTKRSKLWTGAGVCVGLFLGLLALTHAHPAFAAEEAMKLGQPNDWAFGLQLPASPVKEFMEQLHHGLLTMITAISLFVMGLLLWVMIRYNRRANPVPSKTTHNTLIEVVWTLIPVIILVILIIPSMKLLYFADRTRDADMTLNITGYQWYWGYEYPDNGGINFMANLVPDKDIKEGQLRLLSTDNPIVLPVDTNIRLMITGAEVLHSWAVPAFGVKLDAVPGRHNETWVRIDKEGTFYGQCSELCGQGHGFMPIEVHAVSKEAFAEWVKKQGGTMPAVKADAGNAGAAEAATTAATPEATTEDATEDKAGEEPAGKKAGE